MDVLQKLGVIYWKVDGENDPKLQAIRDVRGYSYKVCLCGRICLALIIGDLSSPTCFV